MPSYYASLQCPGKGCTDKAKNSDGSNRTPLNQERQKLTFHTAAAIMNCKIGTSPTATYGSPALPLIDGDCNARAATSAAGRALNGEDIQAIKDVAALLDTFNNSGDSIPLPSTCTTCTSALVDSPADPKNAEAMAKTIYSDTNGETIGGTPTLPTPNLLTGVKGYDDKYWSHSIEPFDT